MGRPGLKTCGLILVAASAVGLAAPVAPTADTYQAEVAPLLARYCVSCHGGDKPKAGLNLSKYKDTADVAADLKTWQGVLENVEADAMPPADKPQPTEAESAVLRRWIKARLGPQNCNLVDPGHVTLRRLNRAEYNNTIRDLLDLDIRPADDFPSDDVGYGFDNIGEVLSLSPPLLEKYLRAAEVVADRAIVADGRPEMPSKKLSGDKIVGGGEEEGAKVLAGEGEVFGEFQVPKDGDYVIRLAAYAHQAGPDVAKAALRLDGKEIARLDVPATAAKLGTYEHAIKLKKGRRKLAVAFLNDFYDPSNADPNRRDRNLLVESIELRGPSADGTMPESHKRVIPRAIKPGEAHATAALEMLRPFVGRAFRRPATFEELSRLVRLVEMVERDGSRFEEGMRLALTAVLTSPQFLFKVEVDRPAAKGGAVEPVSDHELATRLSYFLWSSMPDDQLFKLASLNTLHEDANLDAQVKRMLADPRAAALTENFAGQWLQIRNLRTVNPDPGRFPAFDDALRFAMQRETELFFESIVREDRSILDFLDINYTYLNERLAKHYGIKGVKGDEFRKVMLKGDRRGGVLTQASVLTITSNPTRTSPVKRGRYILDQILGTPPPPAPPDVPELKESPKGDDDASLRVRMEQHRANPACASCHARMDPLGFGFENYDAVGAWRDLDGKFPIDASGVLPGGKAFKGSKGLRDQLKARKADFARCLAEKMLTYALGRGLQYNDRCAVERIDVALDKDNNKFSRLVREVVKSEPFRKRRGGESR